MSGKRLPTDVIKAKGKKHLSMPEEEARREVEVTVDPPKYVRPPKWLPDELKKDFKKYAGQLVKLNIFSALDKDSLGRYLLAQSQWERATLLVSSALADGDVETAEKWSKLQDRYFKQARGCAADLGLTISSRCRLVIPQPQDDDEDDLKSLFGGNPYG